MCDVASVHDEIVRQRHNSRHCERLGNRHRTVYRGRTTRCAEVDRSATNRNGIRSRGQNLRDEFVVSLVSMLHERVCGLTRTLFWSYTFPATRISLCLDACV